MKGPGRFLSSLTLVLSAAASQAAGGFDIRYVGFLDADPAMTFVAVTQVRAQVFSSLPDFDPRFPWRVDSSRTTFRFADGSVRTISFDEPGDVITGYTQTNVTVQNGSPDRFTIEGTFGKAGVIRRLTLDFDDPSGLALGSSELPQGPLPATLLPGALVIFNQDPGGTEETRGTITQATVEVVPEPATLAALGLGLAALARRRRRTLL